MEDAQLFRGHPENCHGRVKAVFMASRTCAVRWRGGLVGFLGKSNPACYGLNSLVQHGNGIDQRKNVLLHNTLSSGSVMLSCFFEYYIYYTALDGISNPHL